MCRFVCVGYDRRENEAFEVASFSFDLHAPGTLRRLLWLETLRRQGLYTRPTSYRNGQLWDDISGAPMSTEFAISRFLTPHITGGGGGWALFTDSDVLVRGDLDRLFARADSRYAIMCVKHDHRPVEGVKKDGLVQQHYACKNWSSVMLFNLDHPANKALTVELINTAPGRDLHRFCWLDDDLIGALPPEWNYLVGHTQLPDGVEPRIVHFTAGGPWLEQFADVEYAAEWRAARDRMHKERAIANLF